MSVPSQHDMNNPEFENEVIESIDESGYSEKQSDKQVDTKGTVRQQVQQVNKPGQSPVKSGIMFDKKKKSEVIFTAKKGA